MPAFYQPNLSKLEKIAEDVTDEEILVAQKVLVEIGE